MSRLYQQRSQAKAKQEFRLSSQIQALQRTYGIAKKQLIYMYIALIVSHTR